ncbi:MAG: antibiotic biosynthesis monooxygenase [Devosia sp.]
MLVQMVTIEVKSGHVEEFLLAFQVNYTGTRLEEGNIRFDVLRDPANENLFYVYEVFKSEAALEVHRNTPHYRECVRRIDPIITGPRTKQYFKPMMADFL